MFSMIIFSSIAYADWTLVSTSAKGDEFYLDTQTLKKVGSLRRIWIMTNFGSLREFTQTQVLSDVSMVEFNCSEDKFRTLTYVLYSDKNARGNIIDTLVPEPSWAYSVPNSSFYSVAKKVCKL